MTQDVSNSLLSVDLASIHNNQIANVNTSSAITEFNYFSNNYQKGKPAITSSSQDLDSKISNLEEESQKSNKGVFSQIYNACSKKDEKMALELAELKAARTTALADGVIDESEMVILNKEQKEAGIAVTDYKKGKKKAADTSSTIASIGAGILLSGVTFGTGTVAAIAGYTATVAASAGAKVVSKELMLGEEYEMTGKEGIKDAAISAAYSTVGGFGKALGKIAAPLAKAGQSSELAANLTKVSEVASNPLVSTAGETAISISIDEKLRKDIAKGDFSKLGISIGASLLFKGVGNTLNHSEEATGLLKTGSILYKQPLGKIAYSGATNVVKGEMAKLAQKTDPTTVPV